MKSVLRPVAGVLVAVAALLAASSVASAPSTNVALGLHLQAALEALDFVTEFEVHGRGRLSAGESGGALLEEVRDAFLEVLAL